jgi:SAM-dependent methyltransferase
MITKKTLIDMNQALLSTLGAVNKRLSEMVNGTECWRNIPARIDHLFAVLAEIADGDENNGKRFVDAGCGLGFTCALASQLGFRAFGLEIDEETIAMGKKLFPYSVDYIKTDIQKYKKYGDCDVVYMYMPIVALEVPVRKGSKKMKNQLKCFIDKVIDQMKSGATLILAEYWVSNDKVKYIKKEGTMHVYKKI